MIYEVDDNPRYIHECMLIISHHIYSDSMQTPMTILYYMSFIYAIVAYFNDSSSEVIQATTDPFNEIWITNLIIVVQIVVIELIVNRHSVEINQTVCISMINVFLHTHYSMIAFHTRVRLFCIF